MSKTTAFNEEMLALADKYERQLFIPENPPVKQFILCPVGLVGAGKTTVVKPLSEKLSLVRISGDEIRKILKESGHTYKYVRDIAELLAQKYLDLGHSLCIDSDCVSPRTYRFLNELEKERGIKLVWIHINPPEEFILNKLRNFKYSWLFDNAEQAVENYMRRKNLHENLTMSFIYTFDPSKNDLTNQIDKATEIIKGLTKGK